MENPTNLLRQLDDITLFLAQCLLLFFSLSILYLFEEQDVHL